jgi:hypothetical protein
MQLPFDPVCYDEEAEYEQFLNDEDAEDDTHEPLYSASGKKMMQSS